MSDRIDNSCRATRMLDAARKIPACIRINLETIPAAKTIQKAVHAVVSRFRVMPSGRAHFRGVDQGGNERWYVNERGVAVSTPSYSARNDVIGSAAAPRRAGTRLAPTATSTTRSGTAMSVAGSTALTP